MCGGPSTVQLLMDKVLVGLILKICCVYLDDIIVFVETKHQLYERLDVFKRLWEGNL